MRRPSNVSRAASATHRRKSLTLAGLALIVAVALAAGSGSVGAQEPVLPGEGFLPDGRAWELVSPPDKDGADVIAMPGRVRASVTGDAVSYASFKPFADAPATGLITEYIARRTAQPQTPGWATHSITPPGLEPLAGDVAGGGLDSYYQALAPDLSKGVFHAYMNLGDDPMVDDVSNLYRATGLLQPGGVSLELITACPVCASPLAASLNGRYLAAATPELDRIVFDTQAPRLTADAPANSNPKLYEWHDGGLTYPGVLPASEGGGPAPRSMAGRGAFRRYRTPNAISDGSDGHSRVFFTVGALNSDQIGQLYTRLDGATTTKITASERTDCSTQPPDCGGDGEPDPDPDASRPAAYATASSDGTRVFFTSFEQLTDVAGSGIYMWEASDSPESDSNLTLLSVDGEPADTTTNEFVNAFVLGASDDGSHVYFAVDSQLLSGEFLPSGFAVYHWHEGHLELVAVEHAGGSAGDFPQNDIVLQANYEGVLSRVSADGRQLLFTSRTGASRTGEDHGSCSLPTDCAHIYRYDADSESLACVSCNPSGAGATSDTMLRTGGTRGAATLGTYLSRALPDDGDQVFFTSDERLVPDDVNNDADAYAYDVATGRHHLLSSGQAGTKAYFVDASPNGDDVFIVTDAQLSRWDVDGQLDLYDARVGGGVAEPPAEQEECDGLDDCHGPAAAEPDGPPASSSAPRPDGDVVRPRGRLALARLTRVQRARAARTGVVPVRVRSRTAGVVRLAATARLGAGTRKVADGRARVRKGGRAVVRLRLSDRAREQLRASSALRLRVSASKGDARRSAMTVTLSRGRR